MVNKAANKKGGLKRRLFRMEIKEDGGFFELFQNSSRFG